MKNVEKFLPAWYTRNLSKIVLFFIILQIFTLTIFYIPYVNVLVLTFNGFTLLFFFWYVIFQPGAGAIVLFSGILLLVSLVSTILQFKALLEVLGIILYLMIVLIFINHLRTYVRNTKNLE